jgi:hypothetical protein
MHHYNKQEKTANPHVLLLTVLSPEVQHNKEEN